MWYIIERHEKFIIRDSYILKRKWIILKRKNFTYKIIKLINGKKWKNG